MACIWQGYIPPRRSIVVYRALLNKLPTEDNLISRGMCIVSHCSLCMSACETISHLFFLLLFCSADLEMGFR